MECCRMVMNYVVIYAEGRLKELTQFSIAYPLINVKFWKGLKVRVINVCASIRG